MKTANAIKEKSYAFAIRIVNVYRYLTKEKQEFVLSKQVLRSGTSIGANVEEGLGGQSEKDFYAKLNIAYKEARETHYWLRLLRDTNYLTAKEAKALLEDCNEILRIIVAIIKTMKSKFNY
jgi:four helix bundle protein